MQRTIVGPFRALLGHIGGRNNVNLTPQVIKGENSIKKHELAIGQREIIGGVLSDTLQLPHHIVGKIPDRSSREGRQSRHDRRPMLSQQHLQELEYVAGPALATLPSLQHNFSAARTNLHVRPGPKKRVASDLLSPLYRFQ